MGILDWGFYKLYGLGADLFYRKFVRDTERAGAVNRAVLHEILSANASTQYGRLHGFAAISRAEDYKQRVPLSGYQDFEPYIEEIAAGAEGILTTEPVKYFGLSSGTTGRQKRIPVTSKASRIVNMNMMFFQHALLRHALPSARTEGKGLLLMNMLQSGATGAGIPTGSGTSGGVKTMQKIVPYFWVSPLTVLQIADQPTANYLHLLFALQERNLAYIGAPFPSAIVQLFAVLEEKGLELVRDVEQGRISETLPLEPENRALLEKGLRANPRRAAEVEREWAQGMQGIAQRLWPKMAYLSCVAGGPFSIYVERLRHYGGGLPIYSAIYGATEAVIGLAAELDVAQYVVSPRAAYYEFIPLQESDAAQPLTLDVDEVEVGRDYEIVLTSHAGFYRYRLGDVVRVVGRCGQAPILEFCYRKGQLLNLAGEKTSEAALTFALQAAALALEAIVSDFSVVEDLDGSPCRYKVFLEVRQPEGLRKGSGNLRDTLESALCEANPRYRAGLEAKRLGPLKLVFVRQGTFQAIRRELIERGASQNQVKIPRLVRDVELLAILEANAEEE